MPSGDRTGPMGQGPLTGRALGYCAGYDSPGYTKGFGLGLGRGAGYGRGMGRGFRRGDGGRGREWFHAGMPGPASYAPWFSPPSREDEIKYLKSQSDSLKRTLKDIEKRISDLEKENKQ